MTVNGGPPAPGPQDSVRNWSSTPPPTGFPVRPMTPPPQSPMFTAHKPGIVPLRPLQFGDILDGAVKAVRFNPKAMVGMSALVLGAFLIPSAALGVGASQLTASALGTLEPGFEELGGIPSSLIQTVFTTLATVLLSGLLTYVLGQSVLGRKPDFAQTWQSTRGRLLSLLGLSVLTGLLSLMAMAALIGPGVLLLANDNTAAGVTALILGVIGLMVLAVWASTKIALAAPAIVLEGHGVLTGLRRSFTLTKGAFWRVLGITLVAAILAGLVGSLLGLPFTFVGVGILGMTGLDAENGQLVLTFVSHLSALLSGAITTPFVASVTGLLYIDRRIRLEALDVTLIREAESNPAPRI